MAWGLFANIWLYRRRKQTVPDSLLLQGPHKIPRPICVESAVDQQNASSLPVVENSLENSGIKWAKGRDEGVEITHP